MLFGNPTRGRVHISATYYPTDPNAWKRPAGNTDFAVAQKFGPTALTAEPRVSWSGGEGIAAKVYPHFHEGLDLGNGRCGADILAAGPGLVRVAGTDPADGANRVIVDHGGGWGSASWHLATVAVKAGSRVTEGQKVGTCGATGNARGCHDHFEVRRNIVWNTSGTERGFFTGKFVDPWRRLKQNVTCRPTQVGVNIRTTAGSGSTPGPIYAVTQPDGTIRRKSDGVALGPTATFRPWGDQVAGATYTLAGVSGSVWQRIFLDGAWRFVAAALVELSQT